ncbi:hypothetical protein VZT92_020937 [Zoarces viviparus]|uniref:Uncharacterized protein n=1 Tax=Zoarces viviparus TaxID=48416 RepID=A0AAW1EH18_ZOAVI
MMEVTAAPGYIEMTACRTLPIPLCVVSAQKGTAFVVGRFRALTPDVSVSHRMKNSCGGVWNGMAWVKICLPVKFSGHGGSVQWLVGLGRAGHTRI